jgi:peptide-methionine (R)-S-oxide reductase
MKPKKLTKEQYHILKEKGTEPPFSGKLLKNSKTGEYLCADCGTPLFKSSKKFDSGNGWPSFSDAIKANVELKKDFKLIFPRTEVLCKKCGGHLGHVFISPSTKTKKRYCINSLALNFKEKKK